ncbi:MAG: adenylosuccinate lyase [Thermoplasmata archaeon]|nr:adenylosuccinate lyase [Thermoplasmata archaeon]MCK5398154.1 adenylosuccinate lyase [Thermoplasmata archaeon]
MLVCPLDFRYGRDVMKQVFDEKMRLQNMLHVEAALARAHGAVGNIRHEHADAIAAKASVDFVKLERVWEIEKDTNHDIMAMVKALTEQCGPAGDFVHLGATSNDIVDTVTAIQLKQSLSIIEDDLIVLQHAIADLAEEHKSTVMVGRTHGQFAVPLTFGMKMAVYTREVQRHLDRLRESRPRICVGKMSGAVGTGAALGEHADEIQDKVMEILGLGVEEASLQLVGRDRYVEYASLLANIAASLEKFAVEVRNLQRSELGEVAESFDVEKQVGSSTMAHKRNPITCENVTSLARIVRGFIIPTYENVPLWHERDLSNSAAERFTISHTTIIVDDMLVKMSKVFTNLDVFPEKMLANIESSNGLIMAEAVMMALVDKGVGRQEAHEIMRKLSMQASQTGLHLKDQMLEDEAITQLFSREEIDAIMNPKSYIGKAEKIVEKTLEAVR